ncbi:MAG: aminotransferase class I/II-fold pyridoxal phosphate-dependent enzyme [Acidobacteriota bacterium]|nr:aminotransferase class I/II-fold pyridoxal phosphate-dependent enzyme [Blastocatellia bacterium]MDW8411244.1 aminotransferase class I/II-fold pyridoxal phosphate-dependent enzyme [Acidobacteriota bacterium]
MRELVSKKSKLFTESVIREMTRRANQHGAINLSQGFPDFAAPEVLKKAAVTAILNDINQYATTWGTKSFRDAIAAKTRRYLGLEVDPETEICVTCGSTEAMLCALMAVTDPEDEVIIFSPYYENYWPDAVLCSARPRFVPLRPPRWDFDREELAAAFGNRTRAIIICNPNNPTGKVFTEDELRYIADLCIRWDAIAITDEIYEHILYDGAKHIAIATLEGMKDRTVTVNSLSKTYSVTGWRIGYTIASAQITAAIRKVHDFLTVGAAAPLQEAGTVAMQLPDSYYTELAEGYRERRDVLLTALEEAGFEYYKPQGAYYVMADISSFGFKDDLSFTDFLVREIGVAVVPGSSFYIEPKEGAHQVRFAFCKKVETLKAAAKRLLRLRDLRR